ncbi:MAG: hypothetical protein HYX27_20235 [Acidobacteria bacterium]|nr:hypothetical protein [Acidobacteriota bacterium]
MDKTDSFSALVERLGRWIIFAGAVSWIYVAGRWGWKGAAGFAFGVVAAYLNMRWLANALSKPESVSSGLLVLRYALAAGAAYVILETFEISPLFVLAGLLTAALAAILEVLFQLFYART